MSPQKFAGTLKRGGSAAASPKNVARRTIRRARRRLRSNISSLIGVQQIYNRPPLHARNG